MSLLFLWTGLALAGDADRARELGALALETLPQDPSRAVRLAERALRKDDAVPEAHGVIAMTLDALALSTDSEELAAWAREAALAEWARVAELAPGTTLGGVAADALSNAQAAPRLALGEPECSAESRAAYDEAERHFSGARLPEARDAYARAVEGCPDNAVWWVHAGDAWHRDDPETALKLYDRGIALVPCHWQAWRFRGDVLVGLGRVDEAWLSSVIAVSCNPQYEAGWAQAADLTTRIGGTVRASAPPRPPSADQLADLPGPDGDAWRAWAAHRGGAEVTGLPVARAAVLAGLDALGSSSASGTWALLRDAQAAGALDEAILVLLFEPALAEPLLELNEAEPDAIVKWLAAGVFQQPTPTSP